MRSQNVIPFGWAFCGVLWSNDSIKQWAIGNIWFKKVAVVCSWWDRMLLVSSWSSLNYYSHFVLLLFKQFEHSLAKDKCLGTKSVLLVVKKSTERLESELNRKGVMGYMGWWCVCGVIMGFMFDTLPIISDLKQNLKANSVERSVPSPLQCWLGPYIYILNKLTLSPPTYTHCSNLIITTELYLYSAPTSIHCCIWGWAPNGFVFD